jgi:hypothetical protein
MADEFSVYQFFTNGEYERVREFVSAENAVAAFRHYTSNVAVKMGITERVIITDGGDCVCAEWLKDQGVVFPPQEAEAEQEDK